MVIAAMVLALLAGCNSDPATSSDVSKPTSDVSTSDQAGDTTTTEADGTTQKEDGKTDKNTNTNTNTNKNPSSTTASSSSSRKTVTTTTKSTRRTISTTPFKGSVDDIFPVSHGMTIQQSCAKVTNQNIPLPTQKVASNFYRISDYNPTYQFTHHPGLAVFKGKLFASFSRGKMVEDAPGQHAVVASAPLNNLNSWSAPNKVAESQFGTKLGFVIPGFFFATEDKLMLYYMDKQYTPSSLDANENYITDKGKHPHTYINAANMMIYTTDGVNWSEPVQVGVAANESPRKSLTGQWFAGSGNKLLFSDKEKPDGYYWDLIGMTAEQLAYNGDGMLQYRKVLTEASWYQTRDYVIHQMLRSYNGYVWMSESYDNGKTFTKAFSTKFTSDSTMANFGNLPDGRIYFVGNANNKTMGKRMPMHLYVSDDGYNFDTGYILRDESYTMRGTYNWTKIGGFAYPEVLIHDGYMYVIHSQLKEVMSLSRVKLSDI